MATTPKTPSRRAPARRAAQEKTLPAYNLADGAGSFRHGLTARERAALDRALDIVGRALADDRTVFSDPAAVKDYIQLQLGGEPAEHFAVLFLDAQHRGIAFERVFSGTLAQTSV